MHGLARLLTTLLALLVCTGTVGASVGVELANRRAPAPESFTAVTSRALRYGPFDGPVAIREVSTLPGGQTQGQILDSMGRIHQITLDEQVALTLQWNASGTLASITGRGLAESRSYDPASPHRLTGIDIRREGAPVAAAPLVHLTYLHNFAAAGQAVGQVEPWLTVQRSDDGAPDVVSRYFVDAQLRLVKSEEDAVTRTYSWHADGRRDLEEVSAPGVEHSIRHSYDAFGQLEGLTRWTGPNEPAEYTVEVQSDGVGQVTDYADLETGLSRHLVWDAEGHLSTQVLTPAPALGQPASTWAYRYNARDQRVAKVAVGGPVAPTAYLWGAGGLLRESGASTTDYVHGAGMILAAGGTRLAHDHLGSPIASLAQNALNPETGTFDGWGRYFSGAAPNADGSTAPTTHVGYTGHAYDADSDLTYAEARWYDPDIGAFLSRDPVAGSLTEPGTLEAFGYVRGNPLFYVDPDGRMGSEAEREESWSRDTPSSELFNGFLQANCHGNLSCAKALWQSNRKKNYNFAQAQAEADELLAENVAVCGTPNCQVLVNGYRADPGGSEGTVAGASLSPLEARESAKALRGAVVSATLANAAAGVLGAAGAASGDTLQKAYENSTIGVIVGDVLTGALATGAAAKLAKSPSQLNVAQSGGLTLYRDARLELNSVNPVAIARETRPGDGIQATEVAGTSEGGGRGYVSGFRQIMEKARLARTGTAAKYQQAAAELRAAKYLRAQGRNVHFQVPGTVRSGQGGTADVLVDGARGTGAGGTPFDVVAPTSSKPDAVFRAVRNKNDQAKVVVLDLSNTPVTADQLGNVMGRLRSSGATNIQEVIILQ